MKLAPVPAQIVLFTEPSKGVGAVWAVQSAISQLILADLKQAGALSTSLDSCLENGGSDRRKRATTQSANSSGTQDVPDSVLLLAKFYFILFYSLLTGFHCKTIESVNAVAGTWVLEFSHLILRPGISITKKDEKI